LSRRRLGSRRADAAASWKAAMPQRKTPRSQIWLRGVSCETLCGALLSAVDQRFNDRFTVGMKNAKRKMIKATQKDTHPSSFT
jgi:hypothetical protein